MNCLNSLILEGNVEGFTFENGVMDFEVSVERKYKNPNGSEVFERSNFDCKCFGKMAEVCNENFKLGMPVRVVGRLRQVKWESNGEKHSAVEVICEHVEMRVTVSA